MRAVGQEERQGSTTGPCVPLLQISSLLGILSNVRSQGTYVRSAPEQSQNSAFTNRENRFESLGTFACGICRMYENQEEHAH